MPLDNGHDIPKTASAQPKNTLGSVLAERRRRAAEAAKPDPEPAFEPEFGPVDEYEPPEYDPYLWPPEPEPEPDVKPNAKAKQPKPRMVDSILPYYIYDGRLPPSKPELIKRLLSTTAAGAIAMTAGQSGMGKTFFAVQMAVSLASGLDFLGMPVRERVGVIYVVNEGEDTIDERLYAAMQELGVAGEELPITIIPRCPDLSADSGKKALINSINDAAAELIARGLCKRVGVTIIDTVTTAYILKDENSNAEVTRVCRVLREIGRATGTVINPIHHYGKNKDGGIRGASAWRANTDTAVGIMGERSEITGVVTGRKITILKDRNGPEGEFGRFHLRNVELGQNDYGEPRITCVLDMMDGAGFNKENARSVFGDAFDEVAVDGLASVSAVEEAFKKHYRPAPPAKPMEPAALAARNKEAKRGAWRRIKEHTPHGYIVKDGFITKA